MSFNPQKPSKARAEIGKRTPVVASNLSPIASSPAPGMRDPPPASRRGGDAGQQLELSDFVAVRIGSALFPFTTCEAVSRAYRATIERLGIGGSKTPLCLILDHRGKVVGHVSYNGRVWLGDERSWTPGTPPLYAPNGHYGDPVELCRERAA